MVEALCSKALRKVGTAGLNGSKIVQPMPQVQTF